MKNVFRKKNNYWELDTFDKNKKVKATYIFDDCYYPIVKKYHWYTNYYGYCVSESFNKLTWLHKLIMNTTDEVDHIDLNVKNNLKSNLRICNRSLNNCNHKCRKDNKLKIKGVEKINSTYRATVRKNNKRYRSFMYKTIDEAIFARQILEEFIYGTSMTYKNIYNLSFQQKKIIKNNLKEKLKKEDVDLSA